MACNASRRIRTLTAVLALSVPAAGCADLYFDRRDGVSLHAGDAVAANKTAQMIDPWPPYASDRNIPGDGQRMQRAYERYRTNRTTPLSTTSTSSAPYTGVAAPTTVGGGAGTVGAGTQ